MSNIQINPYNFAAAAVGSWKELDRTITASPLSDFSVGSLPDMEYYMVLTNILGKNNSGVNWQMRMGNPTIDSGNNYAQRYSVNGGTDTTSTNRSNIQNGTNPTDQNQLNVAYISNLSAQEKLMQSQGVDQMTAGATNPPSRGEYVGKWANTSNPISIIGATTGSGSYTFDTGSEMVVLGWDTTDTHTTADNFWQELASVTTTGAATSISSGTFTAKKYLWFQTYLPSGQSAIVDNIGIQFNGDTGSNYARRYSNNGGTDGTDTAVPNFDVSRSGTEGDFVNAFIVNNSGNEKLITANSISVGNSLGAGSAPLRTEVVGKCVNTSSQITSMVVNTNADSIPAGWTVKVWGSD